MKKRISNTILNLIIFLIVFGHGRLYSQNYDSIAIKIIKSHIQLISDYLTSGKKDIRFYNAGSIIFLTKLTGIASESDGNFFGQMSPTQKDYENWSNWVELYKEFLKYDKKKKVIVVYREIDAPGW